MDQYSQLPPPPPPQFYGASDDTVMARRWEGEDLLEDIYLQLTGQKRVTKNGNVYYEPDPTGVPLMNEDGARRIRSVLKSFINPAYALSRISDEDGRTVFYNAYSAVIHAVVLNAAEWGVKSDADFLIIKANLQPLIFAQAMRPVDGWEGNNSKTQILDSRNTNTEKTSGGFKFPGFGGK